MALDSQQKSIFFPTKDVKKEKTGATWNNCLEVSGQKSESLYI